MKLSTIALKARTSWRSEKPLSKRLIQSPPHGSFTPAGQPAAVYLSPSPGASVHGGLAGERGIRCAWRGLAHEHLEHGIVAQQVAVVTIGIAADDLHDALGE